MNKIYGPELIQKYTKGKMSSRPEFYSGRGATVSDLNGELLELIYDGVLKEKGEAAARNFVNLVANIKVLSATGFLNEFYAWIIRDCPEPKREINASDIDLPTNDDEKYVGGMMTLLSALGRGDRDDTYMIKSGFCRKHRDELDDPDAGELTIHGYFRRY